MDDVSLALTDDELVALAVGFGRPWPFELPSLDEDEEQLVAAARRGLRALLVRDLVREGREGTAVSGAVAELLEPALQGELTSVLSVASPEGDVRSGIAFAWYRSEAASLLECLNAGGTHDFGPCDAASWVSLVRGLSDLAVADDLAAALPGVRKGDGLTVAVGSAASGQPVRSLWFGADGVRRHAGAAIEPVSSDERHALIGELVS